MHATLALSLLVAVFCLGQLDVAEGRISETCLACICEIEGCDRNVGKCRWDVNSDSCGPFQIKHVYWIDCYKPGGSWRSCTKQMGCSQTCVRKYMNRYGDRCARKAGHRATCKDYARVHNGGPNGCRNSRTFGYWRKIAACCRRRGGC
ncbi:Lysozyme 1 [Lamellibrachia satsuma]|nr:Lysozyme 1 [Lamellibrachia satsuma]